VAVAGGGARTSTKSGEGLLSWKVGALLKAGLKDVMAAAAGGGGPRRRERRLEWNGRGSGKWLSVNNLVVDHMLKHMLLRPCVCAPVLPEGGPLPPPP